MAMYQIYRRIPAGTSSYNTKSNLILHTCTNHDYYDSLSSDGHRLHKNRGKNEFTQLNLCGVFFFIWK